MRCLPILVSLFAVVATASADEMKPQIDINSLPPTCRWMFLKTPNPPLRVHLSSLTSAANCSAEARMNAVNVTPTPEGLRALEDAVAPSIAILDTVIATGDTEAKIIAQQAKADTYAGISTRLSASVAPPRSLVGAQGEDFHRRADIAWNLGRPMRENANVAFAEVRRLGATPEGRQFCSNPVVAYAVDQAHSETAQVARR